LAGSIGGRDDESARRRRNRSVEWFDHAAPARRQEVGHAAQRGALGVRQKPI
jgi:hypothetical protein